MRYGWIPNLICEDPAILHDRPLEGSGRFVLHRQDDGVIHVEYATEDGAADITVTIVDGFFQMDGLHGWEHGHAYPVMQNLYILLRESYHKDVTHTRGGGLSVVEADDMGAAIISVADLMTKGCDLFLDEVDWISDVMILRSLYLNGKGSAEYGLSYIEHYNEALLNLRLEYLERLTSAIRFIDAIYETRCDAIQNDVAHLSHATSISMKELSEHTESLSVAVLAVTAVSVMMTCITFAYEQQELGAPTVAMVVSSAIAIPALMVAYSRSRRRTDSQG